MIIKFEITSELIADSFFNKNFIGINFKPKIINNLPF